MTNKDEKQIPFGNDKQIGKEQARAEAHACSGGLWHA
jgi:hypothetical protein